MNNQYFAVYVDSDGVVLVFASEAERNSFVFAEQVVHPDCVSAAYDDVKDLISGKVPKYDRGFGCLAFM